MLMGHVERYLVLRQSLGVKLHATARRLRDFAHFADTRGDTHIRSVTAVAWAEAAPTADSRHRRLRDVVRLARFLCAEDAEHELPPARVFPAPRTKWIPHIYTPEELARILDAAAQLRARKRNPLRRQTYVTLFGLLAATGLRVSEALKLEVDDLLPDGVLRISESKFGKSRLVPLHATAVEALHRYFDARRPHAGMDEHVFLSVTGQPLSYRTVHSAFRRILLLANIAPRQARWPRIHDLRHSFATRVLEQCGTQRRDVGRHFVALSTYMGHAQVNSTYWYLQATPGLMRYMADAAEALIAREAP